MTMAEYQEMLINEIDAGNIETFTQMQKCLRENKYDPEKAYKAYVEKALETANVTPEANYEVTEDLIAFGV